MALINEMSGVRHFRLPKFQAELPIDPTNSGESMGTTLNSVSANIGPDGIAERLERDGYVIVEGLAPESVARALTELTPHIDETHRGNTYFEGKHVRNLEGLSGRSKAAEQLMVHPLMLAVADRILLPYCVRYQLNWTSCPQLESGAEAQ